MRRLTINKYGADSFFIRGVEAALLEMGANLPHQRGDKTIQVNIWVISQKNLTDILPFVNRPDPKVPSIVFCSERCQCLLQDNPLDCNICFFDLDIEVDRLKKELPNRLTTLFMTGAFNCNIHTSPVLSSAERETVRRLSMGLSPSGVAKLTNRSVKTISTHKRNSMKRLGVVSNQELILKARILNRMFGSKPL